MSDRSRDRPPLRRWIGATLAATALLVLVVTPAGANAQQSRASRPLEVRADVLLGHIDAAHLGIGVTRSLASYFHLNGVLAAGAARAGGTTVGSGRVDVTGRFHLDPFRQNRWGIYAAPGVSIRHEAAPGTRAYLTLAVGAEFPGVGRAHPRIEGGIGGGTRLGIILATAQSGRR